MKINTEKVYWKKVMQKVWQNKNTYGQKMYLNENKHWKKCVEKSHAKGISK